MWMTWVCGSMWLKVSWHWKKKKIFHLTPSAVFTDKFCGVFTPTSCNEQAWLMCYPCRCESQPARKEKWGRKRHLCCMCRKWELCPFATLHRANIMQGRITQPETRANMHIDMTCLRLVCSDSLYMCTMVIAQYVLPSLSSRGWRLVLFSLFSRGFSTALSFLHSSVHFSVHPSEFCERDISAC